MKYHFEDTNNIRNGLCENIKISKDICDKTKNYHKHPAIEQPDFLSTKLFLYQRANLAWMLNRESDKKKFILDESRLVNFGPDLEFNFNPEILSFHKRKQIFDTNSNNEFLGGCICDDVGLGKSIQILTLCNLDQSTKNLLFVPNHLKNHWINEANKHLKCKNNIMICTFSDILKLKLNDIIWDRVIIDEFHELTENENCYDEIINIKSKFKWAVTATPFVNEKMMFFIINFVCKEKIKEINIGKYKRYVDLFTLIFRKNTKENVKVEHNIPKINQETYYFDFTEKERLYYDSIIDNNKEEINKKKRFFCINPCLYLIENNIKFKFKSVNALDEDVKGIHTKQIKMEEEKLDKLKEENKLINENEIKKQEQYIESLKKNFTYFCSKLDIINKSKKIESNDGIEYKKIELNDECGICLEKLEKEITLLHCGHYFCTECIECMKSFDKCPTCRLSLENSILYTINANKKEDTYNIIEKYGTKIGNLINICNKLDGKIVLYSHSPSLLTNIVEILNENNLKTKLYENKLDYFETDDTKIIVLSSHSNASGLHIICAKNIIILEPIIGEYMYRKQIENQMVGRLHRIGQNNEINFIRLIMKNSIESNIENENKINDICYSNYEIKEY
jgi:SNF2 family DNA or RNA helicase